MERTYEPVPDRDADVVGLIAYSILAAMTRLAKDSDQAPTFEAKVEHARMATRVFDTYTQVETWCQHRGVDLADKAQAFDGLYDDLDARTRPTTWYERTVKTYVTLGILGGLLREIASRKTCSRKQSGILSRGSGSARIWLRFSRPMSSLPHACRCGREGLLERYWDWCAQPCSCTLSYRILPKTQILLLRL